MGSSAMQITGAKGRKDVVMFNADDLVIVDKPTGPDGKPHPLYDERVNIPVRDSLVKSIIKFGVRDPIEVRSVVNAAGKSVAEVVDGRQRVRATREANRRIAEEAEKNGTEPVYVYVPAMVVNGRNDGTMIDIMVLKNEQRQDDTITVKAAKLQRLLEYGRTMEDCEVLFGVSKDTLENWLQLINMDPEVLKAVNQTGKRGAGLPMVVALDLARLPLAEQKPTYDKMQAEGTIAGTAAFDFLDKELTSRGMAPTSRGTAAKEKAAAKKNGDGEGKGGKAKASKEESDTVRMQSRKAIQTVLANIRDAEKDERPEASRVLSWVLGEGTLGARWTEAK